MVSSRQIEANRHNAMRSTGPKTARGRATSSKNSRKHGLYGAPPPDLVLAIYQLIVGDPDAQIPFGEGSRLDWASLRLAEAEARLWLARKVDAEHASRCEEALRHRARGASVDARPVRRALRKLHKLSDAKFDRAVCGDISVVPAESMIVYAPYWRLMTQTGTFGSGGPKVKLGLATMLLSEHLIDAVDTAGRGKLPRDNLRLRAQIEGKRARALAAWLRIRTAAGANVLGRVPPKSHSTTVAARPLA